MEFQKISEFELSSDAKHQKIFDSLIREIDFFGGIPIERNFKKGCITAAWPYGLDPFGLRISIHLCSESLALILIKFSACFRDYPDVHGHAEQKAKALMTHILTKSSKNQTSEGGVLERQIRKIQKNTLIQLVGQLFIDYNYGYPKELNSDLKTDI
ncbi:hypothetical protein [Litoribrevibacter albus]|uniref:Uncharacterized protein n=1 Tax=Litoribrevibacter albus TaxID=1473156 RepID=A0AA37S8H9_9GAMM|nr:hypothetical protein [Litoribrevibacter albus]GLQ30361.1 hypothetical protein GCM10007876_08390 [Litoribrevibacter albus]